MLQQNLLFCGNLYRNHVPAGSVCILGITPAECMCCKWNFLVLAFIAVMGEDWDRMHSSHLAKGKAFRLGAVL